ncbi:MAG TPA: MerR family transcriptional regulator [Phnomibacter sp.]|nr:MerR family transcriptional regulator [Phnomibacter sp.]
MQEFTIKDMERLSGIKAHTLRVWEQRYGIIKPQRDPGKHRHYNNDDLKKLLRVAHLYDQGYKISHICKLGIHEINDIIQPVHSPAEAKKKAMLILTEAIVDFDEATMHRHLDQLIRQVGFEAVMVDVAFPLLNKLGLLWMTDKVVPGEEHFASNIILQKIIYATDQLGKPTLLTDQLVLLLAPEGEHHEIGLLFMNYLLRKNGCATVYLGTNISEDVAGVFIDKYSPSHLHIHPTCNLQDPELEDWIRGLMRTGAGAKVVVSGPLVPELKPQFSPGEVIFLSNENEIQDHLVRMRPY